MTPDSRRADHPTPSDGVAKRKLGWVAHAAVEATEATAPKATEAATAAHLLSTCSGHNSCLIGLPD
jgi:hypothetical protein